MKIIKSERHIKTKGMGILDVKDAIEQNGGSAWLTVQAEGGDSKQPSSWHSEFTVEEWMDFKKAVNDAKMSITDVWIEESKNKIKENKIMSRFIKSDFWEEGYQAYYDGENYADYPTNISDREAEEWMSGWDYANNEDEKGGSPIKNGCHGKSKKGKKKSVKSARFIKSGAGASYDITLEGVELDDKNFEILDQDEDSIHVKVPIKHCYVDKWSANSYYEGIDSDYEGFGDIDREIEGGYVNLTIDIWEEDVTESFDYETISRTIPSVIDITATYGGGWLHVNLPNEGMQFDYEHIKNHDIGAYDDIHIDEVDIECPNICADINAFFENPQEYDPFYDDEITNSRKQIKSGLNDRQRRKIDWDKLEFEVNHLSEHGYDDEEIAYYIFEENSIDELDEFGFDGDSFTVKQEIEDAIQELRTNNIESSRKPIKSAYTQRQLKDMARDGVATDITNWSEEQIYEIKPLTKVATSKGTYGMNGALLKDDNGNLYVITARNSNLFYCC